MSYKIKWEILSLRRGLDEAERLKAAVEGLPAWEWRAVYDYEDMRCDGLDLHCRTLVLLDRYFPLEKSCLEFFKTVVRSSFEFGTEDANEYLFLAAILIYGKRRVDDDDFPRLPGFGDLAKYFNIFVLYSATDEDGKCRWQLGTPDGDEVVKDGESPDLYDFAAKWTPKAMA